MSSNMLKNGVILLGFIFVVLSFVGYHYSNKLLVEKMKQQNEKIQQQLDYGHVLCESLKDTYKAVIASEDVFVGDDTLIDGQGKMIRLSDVLTDEKKLFVRYAQENCGSCVDFMLPYVQDLSERVGKDRIVFLASYDVKRSIEIFRKTNKLQNPIYNLNVGRLKLSVEMKNQPYLFLMDKSRKVEMIFIPLKAMPEMMNEYITVLKTRFLHN